MNRFISNLFMNETKEQKIRSQLISNPQRSDPKPHASFVRLCRLYFLSTCSFFVSPLLRYFSLSIISKLTQNPTQRDSYPCLSDSKADALSVRLCGLLVVVCFFVHIFLSIYSFFSCQFFECFSPSMNKNERTNILIINGFEPPNHWLRRLMR